MTLRLTVSTPRPEALAGASLSVVVTVANEGKLPVEVPGPAEPRAFEYTLRAAAGGAGYTLSAARASQARTSYWVVPLRIGRVTLLPGQALDYPDDLARHAVGGLLPGDYLLTAALDEPQVASPPVPLAIRAPVVTELAVLAGPTEDRLVLALAHEEEGDRVAVYQQECRFEAPGDGVLHLRAELPRPVDGVAVAVELHDNGGLRWCAWLQDGALSAALGQFAMLFRRVGPTPLGLDAPRLHPVGWQSAAGAATFVALGTGPEETPTLAVVEVTAKGGADVRTFPLAATRAPLRWAARYGLDAGGPRLDVVMALVTGATTRLTGQTLRPASAAASAPVVLVERAEPLVALALDHVGVGGGSPGYVEALFGPSALAGEMTLVRSSLAGALLAEWAFTPPDEPDHRVPAAWALAPSVQTHPVVLAKLGNQLLVRHAGGAEGWRSFADEAGRAEHLHLVAFRRSGVWAVWVDPATGVRTRRLEA